MIDRKVIRDIERILLLALKTLTYLQRRKIHTAKRELRKILKLDLDELSRLQKQSGNERLLNECRIVFEDAKKALRNLNSAELFEDAKKMVDEIVKLEGHELMEKKDEKKKEDMLYEYWYRDIKSTYLYHGSTAIVTEKVRKYGLTPNLRPWDQYDWDRFVALYEKGKGEAFHRDYVLENKGIAANSTMGVIHLTPSPELAIEYAYQKGPAVWTESIPAWREVVIQYGGKTYRKRNFKDAKVKLILDLSATGLLRPDEIREGLRIFIKLWDLFDKNDQPILIYISPSAPTIVERYGFSFSTFQGFLTYLKKAKSNPEEFCFGASGYCPDIVKSESFPLEVKKVKRFCEEVGISKNRGEFVMASHANLQVFKRIPAKYILKIKEI